MKTFFLKSLCLFLMISFSCKEKSHEHEGHDATAGDVVETSGNQELYNEVMKIHDEVMPKMNDVHTIKQELKETLSKPKLTNADKLKAEAMILKLDSANEGMMVWMREFRPLPDSLGEEKARAYLEAEMEKVKKVRENILSVLEQAKNKE
jgi:hypothetical protein